MPLPPQTAPLVEATIPAREERVRALLAEIRTTLDAHGLQSEELASIELVLAEAMNNIVEHAYRDSSGDVSFSMMPGPKGLHVRLVDTGAALPDGQMPLGQRHEPGTAFEDLAEGGFGWFLIRELARDLTYERENGRNLLCFRFGVALPAIAD